MSKLWKITCEGKSLPELKKALEGALRELGGGFETSSSVKVSTPEAEDDEFVDESEISTNNVTHIQQVGRAPRQTEAAPALNMNELDSKGMPWDERIHTVKKTKIADGSWKYKRGSTDEEIAQIEAQNRGGVSQSPVTPAQSHTPQHAQVAQHTNNVNNFTPQQQYTQPVQQQAPVQPPMPPMGMASGHTLQTFCANFPMIIGTLVQEGKINAEYVNELNASFGVDQIWKINDQQKAQVFSAFVGWGLVKQVG